MRWIWAAVVCLLATNASATPLSQRAERAFYSHGYARCLETAHGVRPQAHCTAQEIDFQRSALDARYSALLASLHRGARVRVGERERAWDDRMQTQCTVFSRRRGSLNSMKAQDCFLSEIISRRSELERASR